MKKRETVKRAGLPGSFTVEASLVFPLILVVMAMQIQITFYLTDTVCLESSMAESALQESGAGNPETDGIFLLDGVTWDVKDSTSKRKISGQAQSDSIIFWKTVTWEASLSHEQRKSAAVLRSIHALVQTAKTLRD